MQRYAAVIRSITSDAETSVEQLKAPSENDVTASVALVAAEDWKV